VISRIQQSRYRVKTRSHRIPRGAIALAHRTIQVRPAGPDSIKGGEALALDGRQWYALWTNSHCEQLVHDQLSARGIDAFLPMIRDWTRRAGGRRIVQRPMFPGYLFVREAMTKGQYIEIMKTRGLVRILGERWDRLAPIQDDEIDGIRQVIESELALAPYPFLREGQRVRIAEGPLAGVEGILVRVKPTRGLLVLSVDLLQRSVAVEIDCAAVIPVDAPSSRSSLLAGIAV
jgi:transcriptional antiterminator NusG